MRRILSGLAILLLWAAPGIARADILDTVNWAPDSSVDGTGTGVLAGTNTVTYTTAVGFNAGETFPLDWASYLGTAGATGGSVTYQSGGALGGASNGTPQTITFSSSVAQPVLLVNYLGGPPGVYAADVFDFGSNSFSLLSSYNAVAVGNVVSATTATTDTANDGFGIQFFGTFGPGNPLQFTYTSDGQGPDGLQTVSFTVGIPVPVPEPDSLTLLLGSSVLCAGGYAWRRRKQSKCPAKNSKGTKEF